MPRQRQTLCRRGLHRLDVPGGVYEFWDATAGRNKRQCRACHLARMRGRPSRQAPRLPLEWAGPRPVGRRGPAPLYRPTAQELRYLQALADGWTVAEIAERLYVCDRAVTRGLREVQKKYGVTSNAAAVAQGLKRGAIRPDKGTRIYRTRARPYLESIRALIRDKRKPHKWNDPRLVTMLDALMSWSEPHAVSVLWSAGLINARDVPQTRNQYRVSNRARKRRSDEATWNAIEAYGSS